MAEETNQLEDTISSLNRVTNYDTDELPRKADLGTTYAFTDAVAPVKKVIGVFARIPLQNLSELPTTELKLIESTADQFYGLLERIEEFDPETNGIADKQQIIDSLNKQHQSVFTKIFPIISYLTVRTTDFSALEEDARAAVQKAKKEASAAKEAINDASNEANKALQTIRDVAAEQGVSQQSIHFKNEADVQGDEAKKWQFVTICVAVGLGCFAIISLFLHKWNFLAPVNTYETVQLALSKLLIFGVISYMLILSARNFMAHKHNQVVNKHRQNALATFRPLVEAANIDEKQDVILDRASEAIFGQSDSGFSKTTSNTVSGTQTLLRMLPRHGSDTQ